MSSVDSSFLTVLLNSFRPLLEGLEQKMDLKFEKMETNIVAIQKHVSFGKTDNFVINRELLLSEEEFSCMLQQIIRDEWPVYVNMKENLGIFRFVYYLLTNFLITFCESSSVEMQ